MIQKKKKSTKLNIHSTKPEERFKMEQKVSIKKRKKKKKVKVTDENLKKVSLLSIL